MALIDITEQSDNISMEIEEDVPNTEVPEIGKTASMVAMDQGQNPVEAYIKATESGDIGYMSEIFNKSVTEDRMSMMNSFIGVNPPEVIAEEAISFTEDMAGQNGQLGLVYQQLKSMPSSVDVPEEDLKEYASIVMQRQALSRFQTEGLMEAGANIPGVLVPKRKAATVREVASKLGFVEGFMENIDVLFDPTDELDQMRNLGLSLRGEEKSKYIEAVSDAVDSSSDNKFIKSEIINAVFGEGTSPADKGFEMLDLAFVGQLASATLKTGARLYKTGSTLNTVRKMKAADTAADMITVASKDPEAAKALGITKADIGDALNPLVNDEIAKTLQGASDDLTSATVHMIELQNARMAAVTKLNREGVLDTERAQEVMRAAEIEQMKQPGVVGAKISDSDETGFTLQWGEQRFDEVGKPITSLSGKPLVNIQSKQVDFRINEMGKIESPLAEYSTAYNKLDPNSRMSGRLRNWFVTAVEGLSRIQSKSAFSFDNMMKDAYKGLKVDPLRVPFTTKKGVKGKDPFLVDYAILQGAKEGKVYNVSELMQSGIGPNSVKLSEAETKAYIGVRNVINHMYDLKNTQIADNYRAMGVSLIDGVDGAIPARTFETAESALKSWNTIASDSRWITVADDGLKVGDTPISVLKLSGKAELTEKMLSEAYEKGYVLAKNHAASTFFKRGAHRTQWSFVKRESVVNPKGQQVINKIPGYVPKQRTNGYFFIKSEKTGVLSGAGKDFKTGETVAWSDSSASAEAWRAAQDDPSKFKIVFDRELDPSQQAVEIAATHGGMYSGSRKATELPFVGESQAEFADSFEAMQHYINHMGRQYPASLYRIGSEQRLLAIAEGMGVKGATSMHNVLGEAIASGILEKSKEYRLLKDIHQQVSFINMIPTKDELNWAKRFEDIGKSLEGPILNKIPGWSKVPKFFYEKASSSTHPADLVRGLTFNHLLGMYNPAQVLVQFSGAMVSFAVSPVHSVKVMPKALVGWSMLDLKYSDPRAQARMIEWMRGKGGLKEYAEEYELWTKSGYRESVINGNADYTSVFMKNLPYDATVLQKAMMNHTVFYKMGELANTRVAFATAIERYKAINKITHIDANDAKAAAWINKDTEALRLNMSRANQADFNKGWKSIPLQFQQVMTKYLEKILPKAFGGTDEFTSFEKMRLAAIPTVMTGAVGVPAGQFVATKLLELAGIDETELTPGQTQAAKFGAVGWMMKEGLDVNVDIASRMTLGMDVAHKALEVFTGSRSLWQWLGPTSSIVDRYYRNGQYLAEAFDLSVVENEEVDMESLRFMAGVLRDIAVDTPTLGRNFKQYASYFFTQNPYLMKDGKPIVEFETMNNRTAFFAIMGFQPQELSELYALDKEINDSKVAFQLLGDTDSDIILRLLDTHVLGGDTSVKHQELGAQMIKSIMKKYGPMEAAELMNAVWTKANTKRFDQDSMLIKFLLESEKRMQEGLDFFSVPMARKLQTLRDEGRIE